LGAVQRNGAQAIIVGESKAQFSKNDIDRFLKRRMARLEGCPWPHLSRIDHTTPQNATPTQAVVADPRLATPATALVDEPLQRTIAEIPNIWGT
jgi:hypothetical protein